MSKRVKIFSATIVAIALLIYATSLFSNKSSDAPSNSQLTTTSTTPLGQGAGIPGGAVPAPSGQANTKGSEFALLLTSVKSISIDTSIFTNPAYKALRDFPVTLGTDTIGRVNPFAPVGSDAAVGAANLTIQTLQPGKVTSTTAEFAAQVSFSTTAPVSVVFQYGTSDVFGRATAPSVMTKSGTALQLVKDLQPNTTYYVQAVAVVGSATTTGNTMSFTTTTPPKKN